MQMVPIAINFLHVCTTKYEETVYDSISQGTKPQSFKMQWEPLKHTHKAPESKTVESANSMDPDEAAHSQLPHLGL